MPPVGMESTEVLDIALVWFEWLFIQYGGDVMGDVIGEVIDEVTGEESFALESDVLVSPPWLEEGDAMLALGSNSRNCGVLGTSESVSVSVSVGGGDGGGFGRSVACERFL